MPSVNRESQDSSKLYPAASDPYRTLAGDRTWGYLRARYPKIYPGEIYVNQNLMNSSRHFKGYLWLSYANIIRIPVGKNVKSVFHYLQYINIESLTPRVDWHRILENIAVTF